ncbi:DUF1269 domain-containing protein [Streptomyces sp. SHP 1-2]|uniref:DUF1269 domain-containing protein n=1 Tax=Streptomyces sp. SHP 1-2 TaxID=2769489 RepID=UPI0039E1274D
MRPADVEIDDDFIESVKSEVMPGTSALFLLSRDARLTCPCRATGGRRRGRRGRT